MYFHLLLMNRIARTIAMIYVQMLPKFTLARAFGADGRTRTVMLAHTPLKRACLPVSPHPLYLWSLPFFKKKINQRLESYHKELKCLY